MWPLIILLMVGRSDARQTLDSNSRAVHETSSAATPAATYSVTEQETPGQKSSSTLTPQVRPSKQDPLQLQPKKCDDLGNETDFLQTLQPEQKDDLENRDGVLQTLQPDQDDSGGSEHGHSSKKMPTVYSSDDIQVLTSLSGNIEWSGSPKNVTMSWLIDAGPSYGIVLQFVMASIPWDEEQKCGDLLTIYNGSEPDPHLLLLTVTGDVPVEPLLLRHSQVFIQFSTRERIGDCERVGDCDTLLTMPPAEFNISYEAHLSDLLPPEDGDNVYNCSTGLVIPTAWRCDAVKQCIQGQDEVGCEDHYDGCEDGWIPLQYSCFQIVFTSRPVGFFTARKACEDTNVNKRLAVFRSAQEKRRVARFVRLYGGGNVSEVIIGLRKSSVWAFSTEKQNQLYRFIWYWPFFSIYFSEFEQPVCSRLFAKDCAVLALSPLTHYKAAKCVSEEYHGYVCMKFSTDGPELEKLVTLPAASEQPDQFATRRCSDGSFVHTFHPCAESMDAHSSWSQRNLPPFQCRNGGLIHYSLVRDGHDDCGDGSDEIFHPTLHSASIFKCLGDVQMIPRDLQCNGRADCFNGEDESDCGSCPEGMIVCLYGCLPYEYARFENGVCARGQEIVGSASADSLATRNEFMSAEQSALGLTESAFTGCVSHTAKRSTAKSVSFESDRSSVNFVSHRSKRSTADSEANWLSLQSSQLRTGLVEMDGFGMAVRKPMKEGKTCPETHFRCAGGDCLPIYLLNNGRYDCPYLDDESFFSASSFKCPGYYSCYRSKICIHKHHLCDGAFHCPLKDDERYCNITCPPNCTCEGYAFTCRGMLDIDPFEHSNAFLRYLDLSGSANLTTFVVKFHLLSFLNLSSCGLCTVSMAETPVLKVLDLSFNEIVNISSFSAMWHLTHLNLSHNPLLPQIDQSFQSLFVSGGKLVSLNLHNTGIVYIGDRGFEKLTKLRTLDISSNVIRGFDRQAFVGLESLAELRADVSRLCCLYSYQYPAREFQCQAPEDLLSSCSDLLKLDVYRVGLWIMAPLTVLGNTAVLMYRAFLERRGVSTPVHRVMVLNLCVADLLMGVYMVLIGGADARLHGQYLWRQDEWKRSTLCTVAAFLAFLSSEVSAFIICLITVDRLLVLRFPLHVHLHITTRGTVLLCCAAWVVGVTLAATPLLLFTSDSEFYGLSGICLPLPVTNQSFQGQHYAFGVFVLLNFVLFLFIGAGQVLIYASLRRTRMVARVQRVQQDMVVTRRLFLVVFTDFCCWFPVGLMALMALGGHRLHHEVNVWTAIFILPFNSMLNPFLYTLGIVLERRRQNKKKNIQRTVQAELNTRVSLWSSERARAVVQQLVKDRKVDKDWVCRLQSSDISPGSPSVESVF